MSKIIVVDKNIKEVAKGLAKLKEKGIHVFEVSDFKLEAFKKAGYQTSNLNILIPPPNIISEYINDGMTEVYDGLYFEYIQKPQVYINLLGIIKHVLQGNTVVFACAEEEREYKYLRMLASFIENTWEINVFTGKEVLKDYKTIREYTFDNAEATLESVNNLIKAVSVKLAEIEQFIPMDVSIDRSKEYRTFVKSLSKKARAKFGKKIGAGKKATVKEILKTLKH